MKLIAVTIEPVQEIAAEPATLDLLTENLRARLEVRQFTGGIAELSGFPLVYDPSIPPGFIHLRPHKAREQQS
ncbi:hypothetical protein [Streptomyces sp. NPDC096153]|uniref:hypothetical protein n=1 Tax=Streptomyces sp. NPDC096153 TaxID=3155548 RepID=UPI00332FAA79